MKQIGFVTRDSAGSVERGNVSAEQSVTAIQATAGQEYSFNLRQSDITGYTRSGTNLEITLADGRVILLEDFFDTAGKPVAQLYVSSDSYISEVTLVEGADGELYGQYGVADTWGKYGADDELIFVEGTDLAHAVSDDEVSMLGTGVIGGLGGLGGLGGVAGVIGGVGVVDELIDGGGGGTSAPTVDDGVIGIGGDEVTDEDQVIDVTGTAEPDSKVTVTIGDETVTVTTDEDGNWDATFEGDDFPDDGSYVADVVVTEPDGTETELTGPSVTIDLTGPDILTTDGVESTGDVVNEEDHSDGVEISGTGEAGAAISVTVGDAIHETTVSEDGTWDVTFTTEEVAGGEYETEATIVSTDSWGNSTTVTETLVIDTVTDVTFAGADAGEDGIVNEEEHEAGVTLTGTAEPGASVMVELDGTEREASVDAEGNWSVTFPAGEVETGDYTGNVTVTATDEHGNSATTGGTVEFDTLVEDYAITTTTGGVDGVVNSSEAESGVNFGGTVEPGSTVMVSFGGIERAASVDADGNWTATFSESEIPQTDGDTLTMTAVATDAAGNSAELSQDVVVDNVAGSLTLSSAPIEGDNIVNAEEASDGVTVRGTSDPGNFVDVQLGDATVTVVTDDDGNWTADFEADQIAPGQYDAEITATTTDAAGNSRTVNGSVEIDTEVRNLGVSTDDVTEDNVVNADEREDGVTFTGTTEPGSTAVVVTLDGVEHEASVDAEGNWEVTFPEADLPQGEDSYELTVDVTDGAGNTASTSRDVEFDTLVNELSGSAVEEGGTAVYNAADVSDGITVEGRVEAGSSVSVDFGGESYDAVVDADGNWTADLPAGAFADERYDAEITVNATDAAGNSESISQIIEIDADVPDAPDVDGYARDHTGYNAVQIEQGEGAQTVYEVDGTSVTQIAAAEDAVAFGGNNLYELDPAVPEGSHLVVSATDDAGNTSSTFMALNDPASSDIDMTSVNPGLSGLEIEAIDLTLAEDTNLTLSLDQIEAFAEQSDMLAIHGGGDDTVTITGAANTGQSVSENGETYDVYTVGDHSVLIDDEVNIVY